MSNIDITTVGKDLFTTFENIKQESEFIVVDQYFSTKEKQAELDGDEYNLAHAISVRLIVKEKIIPAYKLYEETRDKNLKRIDTRIWWKFSLYIILTLNVIEGAASLGKSLNPRLLLVAVPFEAALGLIAYIVSNSINKSNIVKAKRRFFKSLKKFESEFSEAKGYDNNDVLLNRILKVEKEQDLSSEISQICSNIFTFCRALQIRVNKKIPGSAAAYDLSATTKHYVPDIINPYLELSLEGKKNGVDKVFEDLKFLYEKVKNIENLLDKNNLAEIEVQSKFLKQRFGKS